MNVCRRVVSFLLVTGFAAAAAVPAAPVKAAHVVWIEAESLDDYGGWTSDWQWIDQMGSPYLLAVGLGTPVNDATKSVALPAAGKYRLWARIKDWVPEHHPGRFQIVVAGQPLEHVFGQSGRTGWIWEDGGTLDLSGAVRAAAARPDGLLRPLRCDRALR